MSRSASPSTAAESLLAPLDPELSWAGPFIYVTVFNPFELPRYPHLIEWCWAPYKSHPQVHAWDSLATL